MKPRRLSTPIQSQLTCFGILSGVVFLSMLLFPVFRSARRARDNSTCMDNMEHLSTTLLQYTQDWDDTLPPANHWADAAALHLRRADVSRVFHCPAAHSPYSYVFNLH